MKQVRESNPDEAKLLIMNTYDSIISE